MAPVSNGNFHHSQRIGRHIPRCLIFDADDTLWENNIYFQHAIEEFLALVSPFAPEACHVRELMLRVEQECIPNGGYGTRTFIYALKETCCRLYQQTNARKDPAVYLRKIEEIGVRLLCHPLDLRPGVAETLEAVREDFRLMVFSKGDYQEQTGKVNRSGLRSYFERVIITPEKNTGAYQSLLRAQELSAENTYMIGNSPRSDVLPALAAGLWAVFVPHPHTWELEHQAIEPHPRLMVIESIHDLPALLAKV